MDNNICIRSYDFCIENGNVWLVHACLNCIVCVDIDSGYVKKIIEIPTDDPIKDALYYSMKLIGRDLWITSGTAANHIIYNIDDDSFYFIPIRDMTDGEKISEDGVYFIDSYLYMGWLYLIPCWHHIMIRINVVTKEYEKVIDLQDFVDGDWTFVSDVTEYENGKFALCIKNQDSILLYDCTTNIITKKRVDKLETNDSEPVICSINDNFFIISNSRVDSGIYIYNILSGTTEKKEEVLRKSAYKQIYSFDNMIIIDYGKEGGFVFCDENLDEIKIYNYEVDKAIKKYSDLFPYGIWKSFEKNILCYSHYTNGFYCFKEGQILFKRQIVNSCEWPHRPYNKIPIAVENYMFDVEDFIKSI